MWESFKNFFNTNKRGFIIIGLIALLIGFNVYQYKRGREKDFEIAVAAQNIQAANDTLRVTKDRANRIEFDKLSFLTDKVDNLAKLNSDLADEVKKIKGNVSAIVQGEVKVVEKPVPFLVHADTVGGALFAHFNYDTLYSPGNFRKLSGFTKYDLKTGTVSGQKEQDEFGMKFVTGIKNLDKGKPEIFLKSDYPGFQVSSLEGAVLDPKLFDKKKAPLLSLSLNVGWVPLTYDFHQKLLDANPNRFGAQLGMGINLVQLLKKK